MLIWGSYAGVLIAAHVYLMNASHGLLVACMTVYEKTRVIALQLPSPKTKDLTPEKHPLVKKRPLTALSGEQDFAPAHTLAAKTLKLLTNPSHSIKPQSCWTRA